MCVKTWQSERSEPWVSLRSEMRGSTWQVRSVVLWKLGSDRRRLTGVRHGPGRAAGTAAWGRAQGRCGPEAPGEYQCFGDRSNHNQPHPESAAQRWAGALHWLRQRWIQRSDWGPRRPGAYWSLTWTPGVLGRAPWLLLETGYLLATNIGPLCRVQSGSLADAPGDAQREAGWVSTGWEREPADTEQGGDGTGAAGKPSKKPGYHTFLGFPGGSAVKQPACNTGDLASIPGSGRSSGEGKGCPL